MSASIKDFWLNGWGPEAPVQPTIGGGGPIPFSWTKRVTFSAELKGSVKVPVQLEKASLVGTVLARAHMDANLSGAVKHRVKFNANLEGENYSAETFLAMTEEDEILEDFMLFQICGRRDRAKKKRLSSKEKHL